MEALETIKTRRSIRRYKRDPISQEKLQKILDAGRWAPSSHDSQPWKFIVLSDFKVREQVAKLLTWGEIPGTGTLRNCCSVRPRHIIPPHKGWVVGSI